MIAAAHRQATPAGPIRHRAPGTGPVGAVLITKLDTFSRRGVALISAAESLDTSSAGGRLVVNVLGAVAQWEREATAERTSAALQVLKAQGRATGGVAPYGFQFIDGRREWHQGASRKRLQRSSSTAAPASHGPRLPTSSAPPGTALVPAASGHGRAPTRSTRRATASTAPQRTGARAARYEARREAPGSRTRYRMPHHKQLRSTLRALAQRPLSGIGTGALAAQGRRRLQVGSDGALLGCDGRRVVGNHP